MLTKWKQIDDTTIVSTVDIDLLTSLEGLNHAAIGCKDDLSLKSQTLQWLRLRYTCGLDDNVKLPKT